MTQFIKIRCRSLPVFSRPGVKIFFCRKDQMNLHRRCFSNMFLILLQNAKGCWITLSQDHPSGLTPFVWGQTNIISKFQTLCYFRFYLRFLSGSSSNFLTSFTEQKTFNFHICTASHYKLFSFKLQSTLSSESHIFRWKAFPLEMLDNVIHIFLSLLDQRCF